MRLPNLRQLQVFRAVMRTQNITEASRSLNISQPAVSKMISSLEAELGLPLFRRVRGRIYPSSDAVVLLGEVERLFTQLESLDDGIRGLRSSEAGVIAVAAIPTLALSLVPSCLAGFVLARPGVKTLLMSENSGRMLNMVALHQVDLGFMYGHPSSVKALQSNLIVELEVVAVMSRDHVLAGERIITPNLLADQRVIMWEPHTPPSQLVREAFAKCGMVSPDQIETNSSSVAKEMVLAGLGIALIDPSVMINEKSGGLVMRTFRPQVPLRIVSVQSAHRPLSHLARRFVADFRSTLRAFAVKVKDDAP